MASVGLPEIQHFNLSDYKAGTQNWSIVQSAEGLMYFGNNKGLLQFDGSEWKLRPLPNRTIVRSLQIGKGNKLFIGGQDEMGYLNLDATSSPDYTSLTPLLPTAMNSFDDVWKTYILPEGVFFCSEKVIFQYQADSLSYIQPEAGRFENFFQLKDQLYVQHQDGTLFRWRDQQLEQIPGSEDFQASRIIALLPHPTHEALIITARKGMYLQDSSAFQPFPCEANQFIKQHQAYCAILLQDGRYALGSAQNGLILFDATGKLHWQLNEDSGLQNNAVLSLYQDQQQNLWAGLDYGIDYVQISAPFHIIRSGSGIRGTGYAALIHKDQLFLGTNQGLYSTDLTSKENRPLQWDPVEGCSGQVWNLQKLGDQMIICRHEGAFLYNGGQLSRLSPHQGSWKFLVLQQTPQYALEGTYYGLFLYKRTPEGWQMVQKVEGFEESARIFEEDEQGNIWVAHAYKGLYKIQLSDNLRETVQVTHYQANHGLPDDLFINVVKIYGELLFTSPAGIFTYRSEQNRFEKHTKWEEVFGKSRNIHRLLEDEQGNIWFSIDNEFGRLVVEENGVFNRLKKEYFHHLYEDLVEGFELVYSWNRDNSLIGTKKGVVHFKAKSDQQKTDSLGVIIREVRSLSLSDSLLCQSCQEQPKKTSFPHYMKDFQFKFSTPYYEQMDNLRYRYKLEGFGDTWSDWSSKTEKEYTNLPQGKYRFLVQARNAYGQVSPEAVYTFTLSPIWYKSYIARIGYVLFALLTIAGGIWYLKRRESQQTQAMQKQQKAALRQQQEVHEKHVQKTESELIQLRNDRLENDLRHRNSQLASITMHLVQKNEMLQQIETDLKNLQKAKEQQKKAIVQQILKNIASDHRLDQDWEQFELYFDQVHENFFRRLRTKYPELTPKEQKLCAYLRMNLTTKEIAPLMHISVRGVEISRYRLRKKLQLNTETNLVTFIMSI